VLDHLIWATLLRNNFGAETHAMLTDLEFVSTAGRIAGCGDVTLGERSAASHRPFLPLFVRALD
jgi:hypothetical protein